MNTPQYNPPSSTGPFRRTLSRAVLAALLIIPLAALDGFAGTGDPPAAAPAALRTEAIRLFGQKKIKVRGKLKVMRFEDIDRHLAAILDWADARGLAARETAAGAGLDLGFADIFQPAKEAACFPLTNTVVRLVPESSLAEAPVRDLAGFELGVFASKYPFTHTGTRTFTLYYFQYRTPEGLLRRSGTELLLDRFLVSWPEIKGRTLLFLGPRE